MAKNSGATAAGAEYHYAQQAKNRETVRTQGHAINTALKRLARLTSEEFQIPDAAETAKVNGKTPHAPITIPPVKLIEPKLKTALEDAEAQCKNHASKATPENGQSKKKRWFGWRD